MKLSLALLPIFMMVLAGCSSTSDACGDRALLREQLRAVAEKNSVPDWNISMNSGSVWWTSHTAEALQPLIASGRLSITVGPEHVEVTSWEEHQTGEHPGHYGSFVRFPSKGLSQDAPLADVLAAGKKAVEAGVAEIIGTLSYRPNAAPHSALEPSYHEWNLSDAYRWFEPELACVPKILVSVEDGPLRQMELPMLEIGRGKYVGFIGEKVVTLEEGAGLFSPGSEIFWYSFSKAK